MTEGQKKLFVYDRREMGLLILLLVGLAIFAFTLGVHLGKKVSSSASKPSSEIDPHASNHTDSAVHGSESAEHDPELKAAAKQPEDRAQLLEAAKQLPDVEKEALSQELRDEVARTGLKLDKPVTTELPKEVKAQKPALATTLPAEKTTEKRTEKKQEKPAAAPHP